ncbi:MAG: MiaB/RimO family radical SAM methylthiotransferase [Clostridiales bacterium]|nr:MiaB/RimO family radical SAM methylthiotransferase [Clostridiales bacterium]
MQAQANAGNVEPGNKTGGGIGADIVIGNNMKHELPGVLEEYFREDPVGLSETGEADDERISGAANGGNIISGKSMPVIKEPLICITDINDRKEAYEDLSVTAPAEHTRAFVKVQDGCNQFCSYCIIPYVRGRVRSRSMESVLGEVRSLAANGYREVVLTGIHLSSYGMDLQNGGLLSLIRAVCAVDGIERVRLGSLEPKIVTEDFAGELAALHKVCPHFHLSLQSGCDETLRRMNRRYTTAEYEEGCRILRKYFDDPAITTDVIVGFPGETDEEFFATKEFLERIHFYEMHIFKYSRRKGTRADTMPDQVPEQIKSVRSEELIELGERMSQEYRSRHVGKMTQVLLEEETRIDGVKYYVGYTPEYIKAAVSVEAAESWVRLGGNGAGVMAQVKENGSCQSQSPYGFCSLQSMPYGRTFIVGGRISRELQQCGTYLLEPELHE